MYTSKVPSSEMLRRLFLPRSSYYLRKTIRRRKDKYCELKNRITEIFTESRNTYGYRRVKTELEKSEDITEFALPDEEGVFIPGDRPSDLKSRLIRFSTAGDISPLYELYFARRDCCTVRFIFFMSRRITFSETKIS